MKSGILSPIQPAGVRRFSARDIRNLDGTTRGILFIDYDGTLAPIAGRPESAHMPLDVRRALMKAVRHPAWTVSIVSGRRLEDVRSRVGVPNLVYAGNHGFEIEFPFQPKFVHPAAKIARPLIRDICDRIRLETAHLPGVLVEDKFYTMSLHTRLASPTNERRAHLALMHAARLPLRRKEIVIRRGKKVLEVRPAARWDKGKAVATIMEAVEAPVLPVYLGDDNTDEDAFRALRHGGVTIRVGKGETNAQFFIPSVDNIPGTLEAILKLLPAPRGRAR
jgi:trehalose 6-phosphate phosphatase